MSPTVAQPAIRLETSLPDYFRRRLQRHANQLRPSPHEDTLWYLGQMMHRFSRSEQLFDFSHGRHDIRPLALLYGDAINTDNHRQRCLLLQRLGDLALFIGAFFAERYARRGIRRDYFVGMGSAAFDYLASQARQNRHIYRDLTRNFGNLIDLVAQAGAKPHTSTDQDIMRLYLRWLESGDPALARRLRQQGVVLTGHLPH